MFAALGEYKDSAELVYETKADRGLSYLDAKQYEKALAEFKALKKDGWAGASEGVNLVYYVWGNELAKEQQYVAAYDKLLYCKDYKDTAQIRNKLKQNIYQQGQTLYHNASYDKAKECFNTIGTSYLRVSDYLLLISLHKKTSLMKSDVNKLKSILSFEDTKTLIMHETWGAVYFLEGTWRGSGYYFTMKSDGQTNYNLPWFNYGDHYRIENGKYLLYYDKTPNTTKTLFTIKVIDKNTISILCAQDGKTYRLKRD